MGSYSSESGDDDSTPQNEEFNEDQITELITCLQDVRNILYQSLKKQINRKKRKLIKRGNRTNRVKVYDAHNEIRKLCNTIKDVGCSRNDNLAEVPASRSLAEAVTGTSRSQIPAVAGTSRSHTEPIPETSRSHTEPVNEKPTSHTILVVDTPRRDTDADGARTPVSHTPALAGICRNHTEAVPVTPRSPNEAIPGVSRSSTDVVPGASRSLMSLTEALVTEKSYSITISTLEPPRSLTDTIAGTGTFKNHTSAAGTSTDHTEAIIAGTSRSQTESVADNSRGHTEAIAEASRNHTDAVLETSRNRTEAISGTSKCHAELIVTEKLISHTTAVVERSRNCTEAVLGISGSHTEAVVTTFRNDAELAVTEKLNNRTRTVTETSTNHTEVGLTVTPKNYRQKDPEIHKRHTGEIPGPTSHINLVSGNLRAHTNIVHGTPRSHNEEMAGASKNSKSVNLETSVRRKEGPGNTSGHPEPILVETGNSQTKSVFPRTQRTIEVEVPQTPRSRTETVGEMSSITASIVAETTKSHTDPLVTPRTHTHAVPKTCRSHSEVTPGISKNHAGGTETSLSHMKNVNLGSSVTLIEAVDPKNPSSYTEQRAETAQSRMKAIVRRNSSIHLESVPGTSTNNTGAVNPYNPSSNAEQWAGTVKGHTKPTVRRNSSIPVKATAPEISRNNAEAVSSGSRHVTVVPTKNQTKDTLGISKSNVESVHPGIPSLVATCVSETVRTHTELVASGTSTSPIKVKVSNTSRNHTNVTDCETLRSDKQPRNVNEHISGLDADDIRQKESTDLHSNEQRMNSSKNVYVNNKISPTERNIETSLKRNHANSNRDDSKRPKVDKCSCKNSVSDDSFQHCTHHEIKHNKENYEHKIQEVYKRYDNMNTNEAQNGKEAKEKKSADTTKGKATRSESTPNGHDVQATPNLSLAKMTDIDILRNQVHAKKRTASSESTPNQQIEQASAISTLAKITNTDKVNKSTDGNKRKSTEICALNHDKETTDTYSAPAKIADADNRKKADTDKQRKTQNEMRKTDSTPKSQIEQALSNSTPAKTADIDKYNKSVNGNKRKTRSKDSAPTAHVERAIPNSIPSNDKQLADAMKRAATRSDSSRNERIEETISKSIPSKISGTKKAKEPINVKKRKVSRIDFGSLKNTHSSIDLTSDNDDDEPKARTSAVKKGSPEDDKTIKNEPVIDISEDSCFYDLAEDNNKSMKVIQEPVPKPADNAKVLKHQQVIDVDEDTCLYDPTEEKNSITITKSAPKSTNYDQTLKEQQIIDLCEDTCLYEANEEKASVPIKVSSLKTKGDDEIVNDEQDINIIDEICRSEGEKVSVINMKSNKKINEHRTKLLEVPEITCAEALLAANVKKEQTNKDPDPGSSNIVVVSNFFNAPSNNQKSHHKNSEKNTTHMKQKLQGNCSSLKKRHDKVRHASKRPYEKSKNDKNKLNPNKIVAEVTITAKTADASVSTSSTVIPTQQKQKTIQTSSERLTPKAPVIVPELSISIKPTPVTPSPNLSITSSAIAALIQQSAQIATPSISITTSTAASEYRTPIMGPPLAKLNKRSSTDSGPSSKRKRTKPIGQLSNSIEKNSQINQAVPPPTFSESSLALMQQSAQIERPDSSNFTSTSAESRPGTPKPASKPASKFSKRREQKPIHFQNGQINQAVSASSEWRPAPFTALVSQSQQCTSGNTATLPTNNFDFATCKSKNPKPISASQNTFHAPQGSPKLVSTSQNTSHAPQVHSAPKHDLNPSRRHTHSHNAQAPQIDWYRPAPIENLTPNGNSRNLRSNVSEAHSNQKASTNNNSPRQNWHTPVPSGNERPDLTQTVTLSHPSSYPSSLSSHHLRPSLIIPEQPAYQRTSSQSLPIPVGQLNPSLRPLLVPRLQEAMMDNQRAPIATQRTWHIPTEATDI